MVWGLEKGLIPDDFTSIFIILSFFFSGSVDSHCQNEEIPGKEKRTSSFASTASDPMLLLSTRPSSRGKQAHRCYPGLDYSDPCSPSSWFSLSFFGAKRLSCIHRFIRHSTTIWAHDKGKNTGTAKFSTKFHPALWTHPGSACH